MRGQWVQPASLTSCLCVWDTFKSCKMSDGNLLLDFVFLLRGFTTAFCEMKENITVHIFISPSASCLTLSLALTHFHPHRWPRPCSISTAPLRLFDSTPPLALARFIPLSPPSPAPLVSFLPCSTIQLHNWFSSCSHSSPSCTPLVPGLMTQGYFP